MTGMIGHGVRQHLGLGRTAKGYFSFFSTGQFSLEGSQLFPSGNLIPEVR